ncbi:MAG: multiprotein bridging factor aMBF1 [Desulfurococcaceae archaeon]
MSYYCEMCGRELDQKSAKKAVVEGSLLILCPSCYSRLSRHSSVKEVAQQSPPKKNPPKPQPARRTRQQSIEELEVVGDYSTRVKTAREKLGWAQEVLAQKVGESVNTIKRVESGRLKPSLELAKKLERILGIKLLEPVVHELSGDTARSQDEYLTIGDIIRVEGSPEKEK